MAADLALDALDVIMTADVTDRVSLTFRERGSHNGILSGQVETRSPPAVSASTSYYVE